MGIVRVAKNSNYTVMNRTALNDKRLSWRAKGIIAYMLSMPDDWVFYKDELMTHSPDGKTSFNGGFKELKDCGYVERRPVKDEETKKITHWETIVHEVPYKPQTEKPVSGKTTDWKTSEWETSRMENHTLENEPLLSTDINQVLNKPNTDIQLNTNNNIYNHEISATTVESTVKKSSGGGFELDLKFAELIRTYEDNFGLIRSMEQQEIDYLYQNHPLELIYESLKITALKRDVKSPAVYMEKILRSWRSENIFDLRNLELYRKRGEQQHGTFKQVVTREDGKESRIQEANARRTALLRKESSSTN